MKQKDIFKNKNEKISDTEDKMRDSLMEFPEQENREITKKQYLKRQWQRTFQNGRITPRIKSAFCTEQDKHKFISRNIMVNAGYQT